MTFLAGDKMFDCAQDQVDALEAEGCEYIICLGHLGIDAESTGNRSIDLLEKVDGIDVFIDGHSHSTLEDVRAAAGGTGKVGDTLVTSTGTKLESVGVDTIDADGTITTATTFSPYQNCTRAQIITYLWRAAGSPEPASTEPAYTDVTDTSLYFFKAVQWASEQGLVEGETFDPYAGCTRAMAVYFMWVAADSPEAAAASFTDVAADADYAAAVNWAVAQGVTLGTGDGSTFSPDTVCQRGQIVTFLYRAFSK